MPYYLSYVEMGEDHSALILSEQKDSSQPTKIICEVGFGHGPKPSDLSFYFRSHKGEVRQETNAGKVLYSSSSSMKHRTYEISEAEVEKFYMLLNKDRRKNTHKIKAGNKGAAQVEAVGGPDYQTLRSNCKTYAMGMLKAIGIIDSNQLNNFFIQRPGSKNKLLSEVSKEQLSCPDKDKALNILRPFIFNLQNVLSGIDIQEMERKIAEDESAGIDIEKIKTRKQFCRNVREAWLIVAHINANLNKLGVDLSLANDFTRLNNIVAKIYGAEDAVNVIVKNKDDAKSYLAHIHAMCNTEDMQDMHKMIERINELSTTRQLEYFWTTAPPLSKRLSLKNFNEQEKAIYKIKIQHQEIVSGLDHILSVMNKKMKETKNVDNGIKSDMESLKQYIADTKKLVSDCNQAFIRELDEDNDPNEASVIDKCSEQKNFLNEILENLEHNLSKFEPQSKKETPVVIRFMNRVLNYLKKDFVVIDNSAQHSLSKYVSATRQAANNPHFKSSDPAPNTSPWKRPR